MSNEEILEKQVEALEKLLQLRTAIIEELESKVNKLEMEKSMNQSYPPFVPYVGQPQQINTPWIGNPQPLITTSPNSCIIGPSFVHDYPAWNGTNHPACKKCGMIPSTWTTTYTSVNSEEGNGNNLFTLTAPVKR